MQAENSKLKEKVRDMEFFKKRYEVDTVDICNVTASHIVYCAIIYREKKVCFYKENLSSFIRFIVYFVYSGHPLKRTRFPNKL